MSEKERLQLENECLMKYSKAQMIQKYIDELEESSKLSELWCKSQQENQELKKQLDELQTLYNNMFKCHCNRVQVETLLEQQKEFIEYLKNKEKEFDMMGDPINSGACLGILREYKEIIGDKE